ncbi:hypothetical protein GCM10009836_02600 [Pseudonocardia ailaonensis]|uniref:Acyl dehydratase n=1 Tax=Pseudonocardia ailaonensis TaxID=367279 RepID=A0ABN2MJ44_9PSEU
MTTDWGHAPTRGRLRPGQSPDTAFFWKGCDEHRLLIQRCAGCGVLRHPPGPACPACHGFDADHVVATGHGTVHSYAVHHYPPVQGFPGPAVIGLVELDEGVRIVSNIVGRDPADLRVGDRVEVFFLDQEEGWSLPQFTVVDRPDVG